MSDVTTKTRTIEGAEGRCPFCEDEIEVDYEIIAQRNATTGLTVTSVESVPWDSEHECEVDE